MGGKYVECGRVPGVFGSGGWDGRQDDTPLDTSEDRLRRFHGLVVMLWRPHSATLTAG